MSLAVELPLLVLGYMSFWFCVSLVRKRNDVADVAWGLGFVLLAWVSYVLSSTSGMRGLLVCALVSVWGVRLATHIYLRNRGKGEDYRYKVWREEWGRWFYPRSYLQVYVLQGVLLFLIATPVLVVTSSVDTPLGALEVLGTLVWVVGFFFESIGDWQLAQFIKNPDNKGKLMQEGLWRFTRHPNYFGEVLGWWGIALVALAVPHGVLGLVGPITITILILKISGIPLLEAKMEQNPAFAEYKRRTSMFFPLPQKK